jgi:hypothetical protein
MLGETLTEFRAAHDHLIHTRPGEVLTRRGICPNAPMTRSQMNIPFSHMTLKQRRRQRTS